MASRHLSRIEVLTVILVGVVVLAIVVIVIGPPRRRSGTAMIRESAAIREIHRTMLVFAESHDGRYPTPGLINRRLDPETGRQLPTAGPENHRKNLTRHVWSAMIAQEYFNTDILISPAERNPAVQAYEAYDYTQYAPAEDVYWDGDVSDDDSDGATTGFDIAFETDGRACHASHPLQPIYGARAEREWRASGNETHAIMSTRGPANGATSGPAHDDSYTLLMFGEENAWRGNILYNDSHSEYVESFVATDPVDASRADNIFRPDGARDGGDIWIGLTRRILIGDDGVPDGVLLWDEPLAK